MFDLSATLLASTDSAAAAAKPILPMVLIGLVLFITFAVIAFEVLHKTVAALLGAVIAVSLAMLLGVYPGETGYYAVHHFIEHDLSVIGVIVGCSVMVEIASHSGLFHFLAIKLVKATRGQPHRLLMGVMLLTVAFVTFLTIAPATLIMASLVLVITRTLDEPAAPYIMGVAIAANSGAMMTFASGIPTLMIGTSAHIPYLQFFVVSTPLALITGLVAFGVVRFSYRNQLSSDYSKAELAARVDQFDEWALVKDRPLFYRCAIILALTVPGFAFAQTLGVGLDFIAIICGTAALLFSGFDPDEAIKKVKWSVIMFFVGLFVIVGSVQATGLLDLIAGQIFNLSGTDPFVAMVVIVPSVFVLSGLVDNIPVAATMIPIVKAMAAKGVAAAPLWWSLIAATNLGGNLTPVGSVAAVIALHALEKDRGSGIGWGEFMRVGASALSIQMVLVLGYMLLFQKLHWFPALP